MKSNDLAISLGVEQSERALADQGRPLVIVTGCRRSGTTLLRAMLTQHPNLIVHPAEPQFILGLYQSFGTSIQDIPAALQFLCTHPYYAAKLNSPQMHELIGPRERISLQEFISFYFAAWAGEALTSKQLVLKDPLFISHLNTVNELFSDLVVIHIVRDPRANVASQRARWPKATIWECAIRWRNAVRAGREWGIQHPKRYLEIGYEKLVCKPEETVQNVCRFLNIPYTAALLEIELHTRKYAPGAPPRPVKYTRIDPSRLELWRERLSPLEVRLIEAVASSEMGPMGYDPIKPQVPGFQYVALVLLEKTIYFVLVAGRWVKRKLRQIRWRGNIES